jgi:glycine dehydrogenase subunit 1
MARRVTQRKKILVPESASPERLEVLKTYCLPVGMEIQRVSFDKRKGKIKMQELDKLLNEDVAAVYVENPNFLGIIEEDMEETGEKVHRAGGLFIAGVDPISLGILTPPGEYGADIVVGEGQSLGLYPNFGGPYVGIFATKLDSRLVRQMPGRLIGLTESIGDEKQSFCMVLQTREQHIRRETATSNICTNEALLALAAGVYLSLAGPKGLRDICEKIMTNSHYLAKKISSIDKVSSPKFEGQFFREFVVDLGGDTRMEEVQSKLLAEKIISGLPLERLYPGMRSSLLISTSEVHERQDLDRFASVLGEVLS